MKKRVIIMVLGVMFIMTTVSFAKGPFPVNCGKRTMLFEDLKLTSKQEASLSKIRVEEHKNMIALRAKMRIARIELNEVLKDYSFSASGAKSQIKKIVAIKSEIETSRLNSLDKIRKTLSREQWKKFTRMFDPKGFHRRGCGAEYRKGPGMAFNKKGF